MCLQCVAETKLFSRPIVPGLYLVQATRSVPDYEIMEGDYGVVHMNDPFFWFRTAPIGDPTYGFSLDELETWDPSEEEKQQEDAYSSFCIDVEENSGLPLRLASHMISFLVDAGLDLKRDSALHFLCQKIYEASLSEYA